MIERPLTWDEIFEKLTEKQDLSDFQITWAMAQILDGLANSDQIKKFLLLLKAKGEKPSEVRALVDVMYQRGIAIDIPDRAVDIVGTGGDGASTINVSTTAAIITTAAGARTIKHGNRAASSKSGAADLLEALGIDISLGAEQIEECSFTTQILEGTEQDCTLLMTCISGNGPTIKFEDKSSETIDFN